MWRHTRTVVMVLALCVLVVEAFLLFRWYDRYFYPDASTSSNGSAGAVSALEKGTEETTRDNKKANLDGNAETTFEHTATDDNSRGDYTYLSDPLVDGDSDAIVLAFPVGSQESASASASASAAAYDHNIGVWYEGRDKKRWAIFNQDLAAVPAGTAFEVVIPAASESFVHRAGLSNTVGDTTYLDDPLTNGRPDAAVSITQNWNPGGGRGVYNNHPVGVFYDRDVDQWAVYNRDGAKIPDRAAFNVVVSTGELT